MIAMIVNDYFIKLIPVFIVALVPTLVLSNKNY